MKNLGRVQDSSLTLIALKIIFKQINMKTVCLNPEGDWRERDRERERVCVLGTE